MGDITQHLLSFVLRQKRCTRSSIIGLNEKSLFFFFFFTIVYHHIYKIYHHIFFTITLCNNETIWPFCGLYLRLMWTVFILMNKVDLNNLTNRNCVLLPCSLGCPLLQHTKWLNKSTVWWYQKGKRNMIISFIADEIPNHTCPLLKIVIVMKYFPLLRN